MYSNDIHTPHLFSTLESWQKCPSSLIEYVISCRLSFPAKHGELEGSIQSHSILLFPGAPHSESSLWLILSDASECALYTISIFCAIKALEFSLSCGLECTKEGNTATESWSQLRTMLPESSSQSLPA